MTPVEYVIPLDAKIWEMMPWDTASSFQAFDTFYLLCEIPRSDKQAYRNYMMTKGRTSTDVSNTWRIWSRGKKIERHEREYYEVPQYYRYKVNPDHPDYHLVQPVPTWEQRAEAYDAWQNRIKNLAIQEQIAADAKQIVKDAQAVTRIGIEKVRQAIQSYQVGDESLETLTRSFLRLLEAAQMTYKVFPDGEAAEPETKEAQRENTLTAFERIDALTELFKNIKPNG